MAIGYPGDIGNIRIGGVPDPTYSSGLDYARSIAGGQNVPNMIAPGVSYSAAQPQGYTQADLNPNHAYEGPAPVLNLGTGNGLTIPNQMPFAPAGVTVPEKIEPLYRPLDFTNIQNIIDGLNLEDIYKNLPFMQQQPSNEISDFVDITGEDLGIANPHLDSPIFEAPETINSVVDNLPTYQDPIVNLVQDLPTNNINVTDIVPEPSYPSLGASLFNNEAVIPAAPEPTPLVDVQEVLDSFSLLNETPTVPAISEPLDFNPYERVPDVNIQMPNPLANLPVQVHSPEPVEVADSVEEIIQQITTPSLPIQTQLPAAAPVATPAIAPAIAPATVNSVVDNLLKANPHLNLPITKSPVIKSKPKEIPTYNYNDPARLARIEAYFAKSR